MATSHFQKKLPALPKLPTIMASKKTEEAVSRKEVVEDFAEGTTMHGLKFLFAAGIVRKICWLLLIVGSCVLVSIQIHQQISKFLANAVSTDISIEYPTSLQFPNVMICNSNTYRINKVYEYKELYNLIFGAITASSNPQTKYKKQDFSSKYKNLFSNLISTFKGNSTKFFETIGHQIKEMVLQCTDPNGNTCDYTNFRTVMQDIGPCYYFDSTNITVSQAGPTTSLTLYLNLQAYEQMIGTSTLSSLKVFIYDKSPNLQELLNVAPGFMSVIGLKYHKATRITSCIEPIATVHFSEKRYTAAICQLDNHLCQIENQCNCSPHYAHKLIRPLCTIENHFDCVMFSGPQSSNVTETCQESCETSGYSASLSLAKISDGVLQRLMNVNSSNIKEDFTASMDAASRTDDNLKQKMNTFFANINASLLQAFALGLKPNVSNWNSIRQFLFQTSNTYRNFADNAATLLLQQASSVASSNHGGPPSSPCYQLSSGPTSSVTENNLLNGSASLMQSSQLAIFNQQLPQNMKFTRDVFNGWQFWGNLLKYPCDDSFQLSNIGGTNPSIYFDDMMNEIYSYINMQQSKLDLAKHSAHMWQFIDNDMRQLCIAYTQPARVFLDTLRNMTTDNLTQEIFSHLNDLDINNNPFWLSVFYASTAVYQVPDFFPVGNYCTVNQSGGSNNAPPPAPGSASFDDCFTSSSGCQVCTSDGIQSRGPGPSSGGGPGGGGPSGPSGQLQTCCSRQLPVDITYYRNFFKWIHDNMAKLINETETMIVGTLGICQNVSAVYADLYTDLQAYEDKWQFQSDFYSANFLGVQIYFSEISQQIITQSQPYDFFSLICDIGGSLGLFLGASILTFFEFVDMIVVGLCMRRK